MQILLIHVIRLLLIRIYINSGFVLQEVVARIQFASMFVWTLTMAMSVNAIQDIAFTKME
jgi:hypothetical protein